jgi:two-component system, OmpR family, response regulator
LLEYMMRSDSKVVTKTMLLEHVWGFHFDPQTTVVETHMSRLRAKLDKGFNKPMLQTTRGVGYRLVA